jgi:hypothetical protein
MTYALAQLKSQRPAHIQIYGMHKIEEKTTIVFKNLQTECVYVIHKRVHTSYEKHVSATKTEAFMLFRERIAVFCENHKKHTKTPCEQNAEFSCVKTGGT